LQVPRRSKSNQLFIEPEHWSWFCLKREILSHCLALFYYKDDRWKLLKNLHIRNI
jgi:hypothetical protein